MTVGEILQLEYGKPLGEKDRKPNGPYPAYGANGVKCRTDIFYHDEPSIIVGRKGSAGEINLTEERFWPLDVTYFVKFDKNSHDLRFLYYLLETLQLSNLAKGVKPGINRNDVYSQVASIPALPEQQRIAALLDEAFEALATAKANAEQNIKNASALFTSHLESVFSKRVEEWAEATLGEMCEMYQPKTISTKDLVPDGPYPVFGANGIIGHYDKFNHEEPQLLVTCRGATCGSVNISLPKSWITGNAMVVRPKDNALDLRFLEFVFRGGVDLSVTITGSAQPQITRTNLSPLLIRFPVDISEQIRLAETFQALTAEVKHLTSIYERKLTALEELKTSLLHQAFNGEL